MEQPDGESSHPLTPAEAVFRMGEQLVASSERLSDKALELGDDPRTIGGIVQASDSLSAHLDVLSPEFALAKVGLKEANKYFELRRKIEELRKLTKRIQEGEFGSRKNTALVLEKVQECQQSLAAIESKFLPQTS